MSAPETATARLSRLLTMVPWLVNRQGIDLEQAATELGISVAQLETDLRLLYLCGYGQMPDELIDAQWEGGRVFVTNADTIARPLRLGRDEATERDVDPMRVVNLDAHWYLEGWCHRAQDTRLFRMDRIERLEVLDHDGTPPPQAQLRDLDAGTFTARAEDLLVTLRLEPGATWVSDYYPVESVEEHEDGSQTVSLRTADTAWLKRLLWRLGGRGTLLEPRSLAAEVRRGAREALGAYEGPSAAPTEAG